MNEPVSAFTTLVELARHRAADGSGSVGYRFARGDDVEAQLSFGELDRRARAMAVELRRIVEPGARALLQFPPGLDFLTGFFGCLYAGVIAVPGAPLSAERPDAAATARSRAIARSSGARVLLSTGESLDRLPLGVRHAGGLANLPAVATDRVDPDRATDWTAPEIGPDTVAYLQYSSGSTGSPKGVVLTHGNVLANLTVIQALGQWDTSTVAVMWLPMFHDMGLVAGGLAPLFVGCGTTLMSPLGFVQRPLSWLKALSVGNTVTAAPNFAFDLCVQRVKKEQRRQLDLSRWQQVIVGAERIRSGTLQRFADEYGPHGFSPETFVPAYGLAEATLMVSAGPLRRPPTVRHFDLGRTAVPGSLPAAALRSGVGPVPTRAPRTTTPLVACGEVRPGLRVVIADPETLQALPPGRIGEICIAGDSVGRGYWSDPAQTEAVFGVTVRGADGQYLRTGDLGTLVDGQLFVSGRRKDLIIVDGINHYPTDLEATAEAAHPALRTGHCAVVSVEDEETERVVVLAELSISGLRSATAADHPAAVAASGSQGVSVASDGVSGIERQIRRALSASHAVAARDVVLLRPGTLPFTSSGKLQRFACRDAYRSGRLDARRISALGVREFDGAEEAV